MKVPKPRKLKSGTWFIQLRLNGESIPVNALTEKDCIRQAELLKAEYRNGKRAQIKTEITLYDAIDNYITSRNNILSPSTIRGYRIIQRNRFKSISGMPLEKVKNWQQVINVECQNCSPKTVRNAFGFITSVLKENNIHVPNVSLPPIVKNERPFLEPTEIKTLINAVKSTDVEMAVLLGLHSLRRSELLAVTKEKAKNGEIVIDGAVVPNENNEMVYKPTNKTTKSNRKVKIRIPRLLELVEEAEEGNLVSMNANTLRNKINAICRQNGLPEIGIHGLRHSFASLAHHLGLSERETMEIGGWDDWQTLHKIYEHLSERERLKAENKFDDFYKSL